MLPRNLADNWTDNGCCLKINNNLFQQDGSAAKGAAPESENLSLIPKTYVVDREDLASSQIALWPLHESCVMSVPIYICIHT